MGKTFTLFAFRGGGPGKLVCAHKNVGAVFGPRGWGLSGPPPKASFQPSGHEQPPPPTGKGYQREKESKLEAAPGGGFRASNP